MKKRIKTFFSTIMMLTLISSMGLQYTYSAIGNNEEYVNKALGVVNSANPSSTTHNRSSNYNLSSSSRALSWQHNGISFNKTSPQNSGTAINITAKASGNTSGLSYKFVWRRGNDWSDWGVIRDFNSKSSASWTTNIAGDYTIYADIKDQHGNTITKTSTYKINTDWQHNGISFDKASPQISGTAINITAKASGNTSGLSYKFVWRRGDNWSNWGVIRDFNSKSSVSWTPNVPGDYTIYADIKDQHGNTITKTSTYKINIDWQHDGISFDKTSPQSYGTDVNITAKASGNTSGLSYKFVWRRGDDWSNWGVIRDFSSKSSTLWTTNIAGDYTIYADIKDQYGNTITKTSTYKINTPWQHDGISFDKPSPQNSGTTINITAKTSGDTSGLSYKFVWRYGNDWSNWGVIKDFDSQNYTSWTPTSAGTYTIYVDIKDKYDNTITKTASYEISIYPVQGIDVSQWQGDIDWAKVKSSGINFAIIRAGYGKDNLSQTDKKFYQNVKNAKAVGMPIGVYHYSYALSVADAIKEAELCLEIIKGYKYEYPVVFDFEDPSQRGLGKRLSTDIVKAFCDTIRKAGYYPAVYTNCDFLENNLYKDEITSRYDLWLAQWQVSSPRYSCGIWQYSSTGRVNGINGDVDLDIAYKDYPTIIKSMKLNGY